MGWIVVKHNLVLEFSNFGMFGLLVLLVDELQWKHSSTVCRIVGSRKNQVAAVILNHFYCMILRIARCCFLAFSSDSYLTCVRNFTFSILDKLNFKYGWSSPLCSRTRFFSKRRIFSRFFLFLAGDIYTFSWLFLSQFFINNQMLAVILEANPSFQTKTQNYVTFLLLWRTYHFWKQKISVQDNRKLRRKINLRIEKVTTHHISTLIALQNNQLRNKNLHWRVLIWVMVFCKFFNLCILEFFDKHCCVSRKSTIFCPCK